MSMPTRGAVEREIIIIGDEPVKTEKRQRVFCPHCGAFASFAFGQSHLAHIFANRGCDRCQHDGPDIKIRGRGPLERSE